MLWLVLKNLYDASNRLNMLTLDYALACPASDLTLLR